MELIGSTFKTLDDNEAVSTDEVDALIVRAWEDLQRNPNAAAELGLKQKDLIGPAPLRAQREACGTDVTALVIAIAAPLAKDVLEGIWKAYVWPMIQAKFGARVRQSGGPG